jgi:tetratricopeptide (TPR) repeat protein
LSLNDKNLIDSCLKVFHDVKEDTSKAQAIELIAEECWNDKIWPKYNLWVNKFVQNKLNNNPKKKVELVLLSSFARTTNNIGLIHDNEGNIIQALKFYQRGLKIREKIMDRKGVAESYHNIAYLHENLGNLSYALKLYNKSLKIRLEIKDKYGLSDSYINKGNIYQKQGDYDKALSFFKKGLKVSKEINYKSRVSAAYLNIGHIYKIKGKLIKAKEFYYLSLNIDKEINDNRSLAISYGHIAKIQLSQDLLNEALENGQKSFRISKEIGYPNVITTSALLLYQVYERQNNFRKALEMHLLHIQMKDSIDNEATQKATIRQQTKYEHEKAQIVKENEVKEKARVLAEETSRRNNLQYSLIFLGILVLFVAILMLGFIKVSPSIAEGLIFFAFLILFEFVLVFTEPYLEQYTNGEPMYNLLANSVLALLIFPVHAILEKLLKKRIVK